jgi:two-component system, LytTR family, sensor histidine kinase AlgZ
MKAAPDSDGSDRRDPQDPLDPDFAPESRAPSLWPDSTRPGDLAANPIDTTRFDPLATEREGRHGVAVTAFDVCHPAVSLRVLLFCQAVLAIGVLIAAGSAEWLAFQGGAAFAGLTASLLWLVSLCALKGTLARQPPGRCAAAVLILGALAAVAGMAPLWWARLYDDPGPAQVVGVALAGAALAALVWAWLHFRAQLWQPAQASARLAELQSRIRPHFLFNALNTALALVRVDPDRAERVLEDLSALFREALADTGASVTLDEEVDLAQRYLAIEQIRFGRRLRVQWDIDPRVGRARVPPLVLQPLVENAVRHGVEPSVDGGQVWIQAAERRGQAVVLVRNTVPDEPSRPGAGMALANVRERLRLLHDVGAQCVVWRDGEMFNARIVVPL